MFKCTMSEEEPEIDTRRVLDNLDMLQSMIDISADRLEGLRTQCATSAELTQQEIRTLEGKLIKLFSRQLVNRAKLRESHRPSDIRNNTHSLRQWLQVVGLGPDSVSGVCGKVNSLESLRDKSEHEIRVILSDTGAREEEILRLSRALRNLRRYTDIIIHGEKSSPVGEPLDVSLCWDSWDRQVKNSGYLESRTSPRPPRSRASRRSVPSSEEAGIISMGMGSSTLSSSALNSTPTHQLYQGPLSPPPVLSNQNTPPTTPTLLKGKGAEKGRFPTTPPPRKKHQTGLPTPTNNTALLPDTFPLTKSRSHESQLSNKVDNGNGEPGANGNEQTTKARRGRLPTEPGPTVEFSLPGNTSPLLSSPVRSPPSGSDCSDDNAFRSTTLQVPKSPRTPTVSRGMAHYIEHRFTKTFKMMTTCDHCEKQMFIGTGLKCKECKFKCHKDCESKVPPSCGLPPAYVAEFAKALESSDSGFQSITQSPSLSRGVAPSPSHHHGSGSLLSGSSRSRRDRKKGLQISSMGSQQSTMSSNIAPYPGPDSSSNTSSCNSSTPSSPALLGNAPHTPLTIGKSTQQFHFPDVTRSERDVVTLETHPLSPPAPINHSNHHNVLSPPPILTPGPYTSPAARARVILVGEMADTQRSNDSDRTIISIGTSGSGSTDSERTPVRVDSLDSQVSDGESGVEKSAWPRQNSLSLREWDIPFDELKIGDPIGTGRFGTVYRGNWHGAVAIKVLDMDHLDDEKTLESFRSEVATFRKTRHENLVLFMGACMKLPRLAIVTSLCKGLTLYTHIHLRKDKFNMNRTTLVAQQISQGMGYLHARGIIHKDLKTKNIFLENGKVVITDFGLFSVARLCHGNRKCNGLSIPPGWLCYLAPEIIRSLRSSSKHEDEDLKFTHSSDIYAFGTVWYELLCGEWPFKGQPPEAIIWQVGKGMKQSLANLQASRDVKDILMLCWSFHMNDRPEFATLFKTLEKLPKKRLARSPSHPVHLSRSAESVF